MPIIKQNNKKKVKGSYLQKKDNSMLFLTLAVLGLFVGVLLILFLYPVTIINLYNVLKFLVGFAVIGFLIPLKYYQKWFQFIKYEMVIFNLIGVAPLFTGLLLFLNFSIPLKTVTTDYKIEKLYFNEGKFMGVVLENKSFSNEYRIVGFSNKKILEIKRSDSLRLTLSKGLFGLDVVVDRQLIK